MAEKKEITLDKVIISHLDKLDDIEDNLDADIDKIFNKLNQVLMRELK